MPHDPKAAKAAPAPAPQMGGKTPYERATEAGYEVITANDGYILYQKDGQSRSVTGSFRVQGATIEERFNNYFSTPRDKFLRREGERGFDPATAKVPTLKLKGGGQVPGSGPNKDTVPAMLAPGEFVMSRGAVQKYGAGMLGSMNAAAGGTNRPDVRGGTTYAAGGGMIGGDYKEKMPAEHARLMAQRDKEVQAPGGVDERHNQLMQSTSQERIAAYDKKHGEGAYSKKLREKLEKTYSTPSPSGTVAPKTMPKPTGKVVGRENLSPQAQAAIARLEAKRGLPPDMQYTRNGKRISAEEFNRTKNMVGAAKEGGAKGVLNHMLSGVKGMFGGMFSKVQGAVSDPKSFVESMGGTVRDGNIGTPTAEEQKAIDRLNANRARADKREAEFKAMMNRPNKRIQDDPLFAEYDAIQNDPHHPLFEKVRGGGDIDDFGMRFSDFKKFKAQQSQAQLSPNQPQPKISAPQPPTPPSNNVQVIKSGGSKGGGESQQSSNGSELPAINAGNGSKSKFTLLGISF
mgnify:CR=1 FL=1